ncbi:MAG: AbrB/MazE/SpoVT family DNA-binding domain-containing protein [Gammaproteobacteria bacterium]|nr:AbrB/MazE/SpoVT family DNA-binding domain-containing protein [Gammaproteobacteria bacterium]MYD02469.1 AbrB/MazE/SpoVT family DNA-binding domain-containing protein [Gammaproteobacteria bacterium]MYI25955.1 AbrB/MazE/SpoVT family DNA-binding domain-containing protein [Gammaproteobacteria bacterium]
MVESAITSKGQTTLPKPVRTALGVGEGDRVRYVILDNEVRIRPVRPISRLYGFLRRPNGTPAATLKDMESAIAEGACEE